MGTVFAHNAKAYAKWRRFVERSAGRKVGATGLELEAQVMALARTNPEYVVVT